MAGSQEIQDLRYKVMLALYLPILLYAFSTFDAGEEVVGAEVQPVLIGEQQSLLAGQEYRAKAYLKAIKLKTQKGEGKADITLKTDDQRVQVQSDSSLRIPTGNLLGPEEDQKEVTYSIDMSWKTLEGDNKTRTRTGTFTVRRPELVTETVTQSTLYRRTRNQVRVRVPGLDGDRPMRLETSTGQSVQGQQMTLAPSRDNVTLTAFLVNEEGEDFRVDDVEYSVIDPPKPQLEVQDVNGETLTGDTGLPLARPVLNFQINPNDQFAERYPDDANYQVKQVEVRLRQGLRADQPVGEGTYTLGPDSELTQLGPALSQMGASAGDQLLVTVQEVVRINYNGVEIPIELNESSRSFTFNLQ